MSVRGNTGRRSHLSGPAQFQLHQGDGAAVGCVPTAGCGLQVHPPGEAPESGLPAALSQQALSHPDSLALPEAREGSSLFGVHPTAALLPGLSCEEGLQLGMVHVCRGDRLRDDGKEERDRLRCDTKAGVLQFLSHTGTNNSQCYPPTASFLYIIVEQISVTCNYFDQIPHSTESNPVRSCGSTNYSLPHDDRVESALAASFIKL